MTDYITTAEVKAELPEVWGSSTDTTYDTIIGTLITSTSRLIDGYVGRQENYFAASSDGETRYYDGNNSDEIRIDDFVSISALGVAENGGVQSSDYVTWGDTDYFTHPYNASLNGRPYHSIVTDVENGEKAHFPNFRKAVKITGVFGYAVTTPADVKQACKIQVIRTMQRAKSGYADAGASSVMGQMFYVKELDPDVKILLSKYVMENL